MENLNVYGYVIQNIENYMLIKWIHLDTAVEQNYKKVADDTYTKDVENYKT
jgi:hypothetical protein